MSDIQDTIELITDKLRALDGVQAAPSVLNDRMPAVGPFFLAWPGPATIDHGATGEALYLESVVVELHVMREPSLVTAYERAIPYAQTVPNAIFRALLDNVIQFSGITSSGLVPMAWGEVQTIGFRWTVNGLKTRVTV